MLVMLLEPMSSILILANVRELISEMILSLRLEPALIKSPYLILLTSRRGIFQSAVLSQCPGL